MADKQQLKKPRYIIKAGNEYNPKIIAEANWEIIIAYAKRTPNPQATYNAFLRHFEKIANGESEKN